MPAEGMPPDASLFARPLNWLMARALAAPKATIITGVALALAAVTYTILGLGFQTSRLDLLNRRSPWNQRWLAYLDEFGQEDDAVVVVDGPDAATVIAAQEALAAEITRDRRHFSSVFHRIDLAGIRAKSLHLASTKQLADIAAQTTQAQPILAGQWRDLAVAEQLQRFASALGQLPADAPQRAALIAQIDRLSHPLHDALSATPSEISNPPVHPQIDPRLADKHLLADDGRLGFVLLKLVGEDQQTAADRGPALARLREIIDQVGQQHPQVAIGVTGMPVLEHDEMQTSQRDMTWTSALSLAGVAICFWAAFGGWRHALLALVALGVSMCWAFGFVTFAVGHLNLLSVSFASVLIGQGIDFGIHYVAGYLRIRPQASSCVAALSETSRTIGPGILTGGLTTAIAFCMTALTDFTGLVELGIIAGGGILICTLGALVLLPPLIRACDERRPVQQLPQIVPLPFLTWPMHTVPRLTILLVIGLTLFCGLGLTRLRYDHNLLNLQSKNLASVQLEHVLLERADRSVWFALSVADNPEQLRARQASLAALPTISHTEEIVSLLPDSDPQHDQTIAQIRRVLAMLPDRAPQLPAADSAAVVTLLGQIANLGLPPATAARLIDTAQQLSMLPPAQASALLSAMEQQSAEQLVAELQSLRAGADPAPPRAADLPPALADRFIGKTGKHLLKVYPAGNVWDIDKLAAFVADLESVDPQITGHPVQTYYASRQMQQSYLQAGVYACIATLIAVVVDLRRVRRSVLAILPMFFGLVQTFGLLGWLGIPLNAANMIVLPLIFGIGIDDGVHLMHDYLHQRGRYRLDNATFVAVLLTSLTTMVGFGSLILAQHQGLRSLGQVLTLGVFCCLISSTTLLPAIFSLHAPPQSPATPVPQLPPPTPRQLPRRAA